MNKIQEIQTILGVVPDGIWGPKSQAALDNLTDGPSLHFVKASSFADPADILAFQRCKAKGKSDYECLKVGDNGIGKWGDNTKAGSGPACALPPDDWEKISNPRKAKVIVTVGSKSVTCELRDTMRRKKNIRNGAGIDLNPDACEALGLMPPIMVNATWRWA